MPYIKPKNLHPQRGTGYHASFLGIADGAVAANDIVIASGYSGERIKFKKADGDARGLEAGVMGVADHAAATGASVRVVSHKLITGVNTSAAYAAGYPVYLSSTAGAWTTSNEDSMIVVGSVLADHASTGAVLLAPAHSVSPDNSNYMRFVTGDYHGLVISTKSDANADAGFTLVPNTLTECAWDGGGTSAIVLPAAIPGTLCVFRFTAQADGTASITFTTAGTDIYAVQTLDLAIPNNADLTRNPLAIGHDFVSTAGFTQVTAAVSSEVWTIAATGTDNQTNVGAECGFYCATAGEWRVSFRGSQLGSGALNATFTIASS